jgi:hypothetical protein
MGNGGLELNIERWLRDGIKLEFIVYLSEYIDERFSRSASVASKDDNTTTDVPARFKWMMSESANIYLSNYGTGTAR